MTGYVFSLGLVPVQEWIAEARRSRDLKAGSAFLAHVMWRILSTLETEGDILLPAPPPEGFRKAAPATFADALEMEYGIPNRVTPRAETLSKLSQAEVATSVSRWLKEGLETWGAGGKTAAGYGYLKVDTKPSAAGPKTIDWKARLLRILHQTADQEAPRLLAELSGADRQEAAQAIVQQLTRAWLRKREGRAWVQELFAAAAGTTES